jgi:hypothetical protein
MTNIEKVKRILDAGHWVKATDEDWVAYTIYDQPEEWWVISYKIGDGELELYQINEWEDCTIEVIQRIPIPYKSGDKVLVLSNPYPGIEDKEVMVWKVCEINSFHNGYYRVWTDDKSDWFYFPSHCLSPAFDEEPTLSWKEVTLVIDGKEYTAVMK